jgi:methionyl-tRNA formyltransferase
MCSIQILQDVEGPVKLAQRQPRVLFFGMEGSFSVPCLQALLANEIEVSAVVIPSAAAELAGSRPIVRKERPTRLRPSLPVLTSPLGRTVVEIAWQRQLPVWEVSRLSDPRSVSLLTSYQPDAICVACFSRILPRAVLDIPPLGCLNVHPSLLPALRGPEPLFWVFRQGLRRSGVTVHMMNEGMDTGDILAQERIDVPSGISYAVLEDRCARLGGELLWQAIQALSRGEAVRRPQAAAESSSQSFPGPRDLQVPVTEWGAEHVYDFVCGIAGWAGPLPFELGPSAPTVRQRIYVRRALAYSMADTGHRPGEIISSQGGRLSIQCGMGWVEVEVAHRN